MSFLNYFDNGARVNPDPVIAFQSGNLLTYISQTFLDGWINYVTLLDAWVGFGYYENEATVHANLEEMRQAFHTRLGALHEKVFLLGRGKDGSYWYFGYDPDVSDCYIGFFQTEDPATTVKEKFQEFVKQDNTIPIPLDSFKGWLSW